MMKRIFFLLLFAILCLYLSVFLFTPLFAAQEAGVEPLAPEMQLCSEKLLSLIPDHMRGYFVWPSPAEIISHMPAPDKGESAKSSSAEWIQTVLQSQWIPGDLNARLVALNEDILEFDPDSESESHALYDTVRLRYEIGGYYIQISQTSFAMGIVIKPSKAIQPIPVSEEEQKKLVIDKLGLFFTEPDKILKSSMTDVTSMAGITSGKPDLVSYADAWYGLVSWWTDGEILAFIFGKAEPDSPVLPPVIKDWF